MSKVVTEDIQEAIDQVWKDPRNGEYKVKPGERRMFRRHVISIIEDLDLDNDEHRLSDRGAADLVQNIIIAAGRSVQEADEELDTVEEFKNQKQTIFSDVLGALPSTTKLSFRSIYKY